MRTRSLMMILLALLWTAALRAQDNVLTPGDHLQGELASAGASAEYTFDGAAGEIFTVSASGSQQLLEALIVSGPDGATLIEVHDYWDPRMDTGYLQLPVDGTYRVTVHLDQPTGYEVWLVKREERLLVIDGDNSEAGRDNFFGAVRQLPFTFEGQAADEIVINVSADMFDPVLTLLGPDGAQLAADDDSGGDLMPRIGPFILPQSGLYRLFVSAYHPGGSGVVRVSISQPAALTEFSIAYDQTVIVPLSAEQPRRVLSFSAEDGDVLALRVEDPDALAQVDIEETSGGLFATTHPRDSWRPRYYALDRITLARGHYELAVEARDADDLPPGAQVSVRLELLRRRSLDFTDLIVSARPNPSLRVFMSNKEPLQSFSIFDDGSNGITLRIQQWKNWPGALPEFRVRVVQAGQVIASYTLDAMRGLRQTEVNIVFGAARTGLMEVRLELLGDGPVWFSLARELSYGMG